MAAPANPIPNTLPRVVGPYHATALNMLHMVGVGPFITMPLLLATFGGPQAMLGWVLGAVVALCDGLVWAELGTALPSSGGPYVYLREACGPNSFGRLFSFLFVWQIVLTAPLSLAAGCVGFADYASRLVFVAPALRPWVAAGVALVCTALLYRNIRGTRTISLLLWAALIATILLLVFGALPSAEFSRLRAGIWPHGHDLFVRLGQATRYAMYDYAGYWTVNYFAEEIRDPSRTIPRAVVGSVIAVAALYLVMNAVIIAALPLDVAVHSSAIASDLAQRIGGRSASVAMTVMILWITLASLYSALLGYSRIPYAAARDGNFFRFFAHLHPREDFPDYSLLLLGVCAAAACAFKLSSLIEYLLIIQVFMKFLPQLGAQVLIRHTRPDIVLPFRAWLYPLPTLVAAAGWLYIAVTANKGSIGTGFVLLALGVIAFFIRAVIRHEWPFQQTAAATAP